MKLFLYAVVFFTALEIILFFVVSWLKKDFQWLITTKDESPKIPKDSLERFLSHGFDSELGWVRKSGTEKKERIQTVGEVNSDIRYATYRIGEYGARVNPGHDELSSGIISSYGDSYAFSRHVEDSQTWQWFLSGKTNSNVSNYGVGNYGLDQAFKRLQNDYKNDPTDIVVMMVVPETLARIVNVWKHYNEYGNTLGFKGRYVLNGDSLIWKDNPVRSREDYERIDGLKETIQQMDDCYAEKFKRDLLVFPYVFSLLKNFKRNGPLFAALLQRKIAKLFGIKSDKILNKPWELILKRNHEFVKSLYSHSQHVALLKRIVLEFRDWTIAQGATPVFVMAPYLHDMNGDDASNARYYQHFIRSIKNELAVIDLGESLETQNDRASYYVSPFYGAHFSEKGNEFISEVIHQFLLAEKLITREGIGASHDKS